MVNASTLLRLAQRGFEYRHWYTEARAAIAELCTRNGWDTDKFIDVMAVTSPRVQVNRNWHATVTYMRTGALPSGTMRSTRAALAHWQETGVIRGRKTSAFAAALKGDADALVLDVWMAVALGVEQTQVTRLDNMAAATRRVKRVADTLDISIAECQAAIWCGTIIEAGRWPARFQRAADGGTVLNTKPTFPMFGEM